MCAKPLGETIFKDCIRRFRFSLENRRGISVCWMWRFIESAMFFVLLTTETKPGRAVGRGGR